MATGSVWVKGIDDVWVKTTRVFARPSSALGWLPIKNIYAKTSGTVWTLRVNTDFTPPAHPNLYMTGIGTTSTVRVDAPADADVVSITIKRSTVKYPTSYAQDNEFDKTLQSTGNWWSQFWTNPSQQITRTFSYAAGTKVYLTAWASDVNGNFSAPVNLTVSIPKPVVPPAPVRVHKSGIVYPVDSRTFRTNQGAWRTDNNYVYQGGSDNAFGYWFYSNRIGAMVAHSTRITIMKIYVQRVNSVHGVSGAAETMPMYHRIQNLNTGQNPISLSSNPDVGNIGLQRGQGGWLNIPSSYYEGYRSGYWQGFGLAFNTTGFTDGRYMYCYGAGTSSGQCYVEWDEGS